MRNTSTISTVSKINANANALHQNIEDTLQRQRTDGSLDEDAADDERVQGEPEDLTPVVVHVVDERVPGRVKLGRRLVALDRLDLVVQRRSTLHLLLGVPVRLVSVHPSLI